MRFKHKVVLVTGGASGLGLAAAKLFSSQGAIVAINDIDPQAATATVRAIEASGGQAFAIPGDVSDREVADRRVREVVERFGRVDVLLNNAGVATVQSIVDYTDWDRMIGINLTGPFLWARAVGAQSMIPNRSGAIVNIASVAAHVGFPLDVGYISSKAGVLGLTRAFAIEWAPHNIRVNCICPGVTETPILRDLERVNPERMADRKRRVPMGRVGKAEELAEAMAFLASDSASYITGVILNVDGGQMALSSGWSPA